MTTITSPRPSLASPAPTPTSSHRPSLDTPRSQNPSPSRLNPNPTPNLTRERRNRTALRDYYGLKQGNGASREQKSSTGLQQQQQQQHEDAEGKESELDGEGFDAEAYVRGVLGREGLEGVLRVEGGLVNEIKGLDGERKALVYDNYSKLITATETIRKMRTNMDPLTPTTSTLTPAIAHIAETAAAIADSLRHTTTRTDTSGTLKSETKDSAEEKRRQRATVRWVLDSPRRLRGKVEKGERDAALKDWDEVRRLLDKWERTVGVNQVREQCERAMENSCHDSKDT